MANPSLAMIPSGYKAGKLYSVLPQDGTGDFTVVSDQKYVTGSTGLLELVPANTPAFDYSDGSGCPALLVEDVSTNLVLHSKIIIANWGGISFITSNYGLSPDNTYTSNRVLFTNASQNIYTNVTATIGLSYIMSLYLKGIIGQTINIVNCGLNYFHTFNGEWERVLINNSSIINSTIQLTTYGGVTARDFEIWGVQLEQGTLASSYIPTTTTTVTRAADIETVTTPSGVTSITETIGGVEQTPITVIPTTYQIPNGLINKITMI